MACNVRKERFILVFLVIRGFEVPKWHFKIQGLEWKKQEISVLECLMGTFS